MRLNCLFLGQDEINTFIGDCSKAVSKVHICTFGASNQAPYQTKMKKQTAKKTE